MRPLVNLVWLGAFIMALGGGIAASDRRYRTAKAARNPLGARSRCGDRLRERLRMNRFAIPLASSRCWSSCSQSASQHSSEMGVIVSPFFGQAGTGIRAAEPQRPGRTIKLERFRGRWYIFNVWGTWCGGCRQEHERATGDAARRTWCRSSASTGKTMKTKALSASATARQSLRIIAVDQDGREAIEWGVYGAPETFLVNPIRASWSTNTSAR